LRVAGDAMEFLVLILRTGEALLALVVGLVALIRAPALAQRAAVKWARGQERGFAWAIRFAAAIFIVGGVYGCWLALGAARLSFS
jgi:hypothetical protein